MKYNFTEIEKKWQNFWEANKTFAATEDHSKTKYYVLDFFPYPSSEGLHVGHPEGYTATDIIARYKRMKGFNVLHPMGWDAFGLPAEQYAIKTGIHPRITTLKSIDNFKRQLKAIGLSYDWDREIATMDPKYYKWTQWIFIQLYKKGLAYQAEAAVNWCPELGTVLANEEVPEYIEKGYTVERKPMKQWMLKITEYAERLLVDLDMLDWPESTKEMQRNWIGKSEGAKVTFSIKDRKETIEIFTTRPDTLWGATYMVLAPEHPYIDLITTPEHKTAVDIYKDNAKNKSDLERQALEKDKTGVFTGAYAINPVNNQEIPIWISDYVLMSYGTGAIMAVPGHDQRDWEFARKYHLVIKSVVDPIMPGLASILIPDIIDILKSTEHYQNEPLNYDDDSLWINIFISNNDNSNLLNLTYGELNSLIINQPTENKNDLYIETIKKVGKFDKVYIDDSKKTSLWLARDVDTKRFYNDTITTVFVSLNGELKFASSFKSLVIEIVNRIFTDEVIEEAVKVAVPSFKQRNKDISIYRYNANNINSLPNKDVVLNSNDIKIYHRETDLYALKSYEDVGIAVNSGFITGLKTEKAKKKVIEWLEQKGLGKAAVQYKLRDWLFSRQRFWGEPFPIIYLEDGTIKLVPEEDLPVMLPEVDNYKIIGTGESPLAAFPDWVNTVDKETGKPAKRETNTMPQWAGSCWYYLRFLDPDNEKEIVSKEKEKYWMPVNLYLGGAEHAVLHLLYARFWHKVLFDLGYVSTREPFVRLYHQGMILGEDSNKMSKSRGNVVNPDDVIANYGADSLRLFEMFLGPLSATKPWSTKGIEGVFRFLNKVWRLIIDENGNINPAIKDVKPDDDAERLMHRTIKNVTEDIEDMDLKFNTCVSELMIYVNELSRLEVIPKELIETLIKLLSPFAPHLAEELWQKLGNSATIAFEKWPEYNPAKVQRAVVTVVGQINGKVRSRIEVETDTDEEKLKELIKQDEKIKSYINGKQIVKEIVVKNKLVNIVVK